MVLTETAARGMIEFVEGFERMSMRWFAPNRFARVVALAFGAMVVASPATAYVGPGAGLTAIGSVLALFGALVLALVGFVWYPMRRLLRRRKVATKKPTR
jgi:nitric oxide reductase large subunit